MSKCICNEPSSGIWIKLRMISNNKILQFIFIGADRYFLIGSYMKKAIRLEFI